MKKEWEINTLHGEVISASSLTRKWNNRKCLLTSYTQFNLEPILAVNPNARWLVQVKLKCSNPPWIKSQPGGILVLLSYDWWVLTLVVMEIVILNVQVKLRREMCKMCQDLLRNLFSEYINIYKPAQFVVAQVLLACIQIYNEKFINAVKVFFFFFSNARERVPNKQMSLVF